MDTSTLKDRIRRLICDGVAPEIDYDEVKDNAALIQDLNLDSLQILGLITEIEREFDLVLEDEDLDLEAFSTLATVASFVESKVAAAK